MYVIDVQTLVRARSLFTTRVFTELHVWYYIWYIIHARTYTWYTYQGTREYAYMCALSAGMLTSSETIPGTRYAI